MKVPLDKPPVCIATAKPFVKIVAKCEQFENHPRINITWDQKTLNLSFSSVEQTDVATYICGLFTYEKLFFGNVSKLILEEHADGEYEIQASSKTLLTSFTIHLF